MSVARSLRHTRLLSLGLTTVLSDTAPLLQYAWSAPSATFQSAWRPHLGRVCLPYTVASSYSTAEQETEHTGKGHYVDRLRVEVQAGRGGSGCVAFWKSAAKGKFQPADGGSGGHGGNIVVEASSTVKSLGGLRQLQRAQPGGPGGNQKKVGKHGSDKIIQVPLGTVVHKLNPIQEDDEGLEPFTFQQHWVGSRDYVSSEEEASDCEHDSLEKASPSSPSNSELLADLVHDGEQVIAAQGGAGGRGNAYMRRPGQNRPATDEREIGQAGERAVVILEMKSMADIGLVGLPNVGKSTLLRALSRAKPEVADYAFTTLRPQLGMLHYPDTASLAIADIPGLIKGASNNRGLGHRFLRHVERSQALAYVLDLSSGVKPSTGPTAQEQFTLLQEELRLYGGGLLEKSALVIANKADKVEGAETTAKQLQAFTGLPTILISGRTGQNIEQLKLLLRELSPTDVLF